MGKGRIREIDLETIVIIWARNMVTWTRLLAVEVM